MCTLRFLIELWLHFFSLLHFYNYYSSAVRCRVRVSVCELEDVLCLRTIKRSVTVCGAVMSSRIAKAPAQQDQRKVSSIFQSSHRFLCLQLMYQRYILQWIRNVDYCTPTKS